MAEFRDLRQRTQQRRQRQQQIDARRRSRRNSIAAAAAVLAVCLLVLGVLIFRGCQSEDPVQTQPQTTVPETQASTTPLEPETVITISAAGDLNITDRVVASGEISGRYSYTDCFMDVAGLFAQSTASVLNFEGNIRGEPYGSAKASAPRELAAALKDMGVDMVQLANSYTIYNGLEGLTQTVNALRAQGLEPVGAYATAQEAQQTGGFTLRNIGGVRVAFVAFTKGVGSMGLPAGSESQVNLLYKDYTSTYREVDTAGITGILQAVQAEKPDITIALLHWGSEYNDEISDTQKKIAELMLANGVDAILGTHPHYVQRVSFDEAAGQLVAYSLGDFFGDAEKAGTSYSIVLQMEITKNNLTGETKITGWDYTPVYTVNEEGKPLRVVRLAEAMEMYENNHISKVSDEIYEDMVYALYRVKARVEGPEE